MQFVGVVVCFSLLLVCVEDDDVVCGFCHFELTIIHRSGGNYPPLSPTLW